MSPSPKRRRRPHVVVPNMSLSPSRLPLLSRYCHLHVFVVVTLSLPSHLCRSYVTVALTSSLTTHLRRYPQVVVALTSLPSSHRRRFHVIVVHMSLFPAHFRRHRIFVVLTLLSPSCCCRHDAFIAITSSSPSLLCRHHVVVTYTSLSPLPPCPRCYFVVVVLTSPTRLRRHYVVTSLTSSLPSGRRTLRPRLRSSSISRHCRPHVAVLTSPSSLRLRSHILHLHRFTFISRSPHFGFGFTLGSRSRPLDFTLTSHSPPLGPTLASLVLSSLASLLRSACLPHSCSQLAHLARTHYHTCVTHTTVVSLRTQFSEPPKNCTTAGQVAVTFERRVAM